MHKKEKDTAGGVYDVSTAKPAERPEKAPEGARGEARGGPDAQVPVHAPPSATESASKSQSQVPLSPDIASANPKISASQKAASRERQTANLLVGNEAMLAARARKVKEPAATRDELIQLLTESLRDRRCPFAYRSSLAATLSKLLDSEAEEKKSRTVIMRQIPKSGIEWLAEQTKLLLQDAHEEILSAFPPGFTGDKNAESPVAAAPRGGGSEAPDPPKVDPKAPRYDDKS